MNRKKLICLVLACALALCGCGGDTGQTDPVTTQVLPETTSPFTETKTGPTTEPTTAPMETVYTPMGYTLEELEGRTGLFYVLDDGSFGRYNAGGFKWVLHEGFTSGVLGSALFIGAERVDSNPVLTSDDVIAIFQDHSIDVSLWPVGGVGTTVSLTANGNDVLLNPFRSYYDSSSVIDYPTITLSGHDEIAVELMKSSEEYLFGVPTEEITVVKYGNGKTRVSTYDSFPRDTELTITYVEGTKAIQEVKEADYYYYFFGYDYINPDAPQAEYTVVPTVDGYAALSLKNVPAGQYVMIVSMDDNTYYGTVLTVE